MQKSVEEASPELKELYKKICQYFVHRNELFYKKLEEQKVLK